MDEKKIQELLKPCSFKKPPESLLENYTDEVLQRIESEEARIVPAGLSIAFAFAITLALAGFALYSLYLEPKPKGEPPVSALTASRVTLKEQDIGTRLPVDERHSTAPEETQKTAVGPQNASYHSATPDQETIFQEIADELFLLEVLGEDEGVIEDFDRMAVDMEAWGAPPSGQAVTI